MSLSGNNKQGLFLDGLNTDNNMVEGNFIGTDSQGINAISNHFAGIEINGGAQSNVIGGATLATVTTSSRVILPKAFLSTASIPTTIKLWVTISV